MKQDESSPPTFQQSEPGQDSPGNDQYPPVGVPRNEADRNDFVSHDDKDACRPPLNFVVVCASNEPPSAGGQVAASAQALGISDPPPIDRSWQQPVSFGGPMTMTNAPFRLLPRNPVCAPSPAGRSQGIGARGRKRRAPPAALGSAFSTRGNATARLTLAPRGKPPREEDSLVPDSQEADPDVDTTGDTVGEDSPEPRAAPKLEPESPRVDGALRSLLSLSIHSPFASVSRKNSDSPSPPSLIGSQHMTVKKPRGSSFSVYNPSCASASSFQRARSLSDSTESTRMSTSGSARSSPKIAPLTVLSTVQSRTPTKRPPLAHVASNLLCSLDAEDDSEDELDTPRYPSSDIHHLPTFFAANNSPGSVRQSFESPAGKRSATSRSPRTPLPRVTLTPRSSTSRGNSIPFLPSPAGLGAATGASPLFEIRRPSGSSPRKRDSLMDRSPNKKLARLTSSESSNSLAFSVDESPGGDFMQGGASGAAGLAFRHLPSSFIPMPDWIDTGSKNDDTPASVKGRDTLLKSNLKACPDSADAAVDAGVNGCKGIKSKSLLTPSRSNGILDMLENVPPGRQPDPDTESLSDCEEKDFFLTAPEALDEERQASQSRRRRRVYDGHPSSASLNSCAHASHASLVGVDIPHQDSVSAFSEHCRTSFSNLSAKRRGVGASSTAATLGDRCTSEGSLFSLGLPLDGGSGEEAVRDLATPPPTAPVSSNSPPPLPNNKEFLGKPPTLCVANSDHRSVSLAISQMAFQVHHMQKTAESPC